MNHLSSWLKFIKLHTRKKKQMILEIKRVQSDDEGTDGVIYTEGFACYTLELPWRDNQVNISCIPNGTYTAMLDDSVTIGKMHVIRLDNVQGRTGILIHVANVAGDVVKMLDSDVQGCIAVGFGKGELHNQKAVFDSRDAMTELLAIVGTETIGVTIENLAQL